MRRIVSTLAGFLVVGLTGLEVLLSLRASEGQDRRYPRYAVAVLSNGAALWIIGSDTG
jgi:hypothetical protein